MVSYRKIRHLRDGETPRPMPRMKRRPLASIYALFEPGRERIWLMIGLAYGSETATPRPFNVFSTRQAVSNPHMGSRHLRVAPAGRVTDSDL